MTDFLTLSHTSTSKILTLLYTSKSTRYGRSLPVWAVTDSTTRVMKTKSRSILYKRSSEP